jgi:hypothetical protein
MPPETSRADRFEIRFTARADTVEKLRMVQDLLSHAVPDGDVAEVVDRAVTSLAEELLKRKFGLTASPREGKASPASGDPSNADKREAYLRDRGRCTWISRDGRRCDSRRFLQFDHVDGRFVGGASTADRIRLRCGAHNRLEAETLYGTPVGARDGGGSRVNLAMFPDFIRPGTEGERKGCSGTAVVWARTSRPEPATG